MRGYNNQQVPIRDGDALGRHKRAEHPTEYQAAIEARRAKAHATRQANAVEARQVSDARLAASRPVVVRYRGEQEVTTLPSSKILRHQVDPIFDTSRPRFPDADAYQGYKSLMAQIAGLTAEADIYLIIAWEMGTPVTLADLDELDRAAQAQ